MSIDTILTICALIVVVLIIIGLIIFFVKRSKRQTFRKKIIPHHDIKVVTDENFELNVVNFLNKKQYLIDQLETF